MAMADNKKLSDDLRPASFRGVPFHVSTADLSAGRRTQVHEYPQRDNPWAEDLGRATRDLSFDAFVVGKDYVDQLKKLLGALETRGPGTLIHPWLGTMEVSLKESARVSLNSALGQARVSLSFVEGGALEFPSAGDSTPDQSRLAAENIEVTAVDDFAANFSIDGFQDFVTAAASGNLTSMIGLVSGGGIPGLDALNYANRAAGALQSAIGLISNPASLGWSLVGFLGVTDYLSSGMRLASLARSLVALAGSDRLAAPTAPGIYTPSRQQAYTNAVAVNALTRQTLLAQAVGISSLVPATVYEETTDLRDALTAALDTEALMASDGAYMALTDARSAVWKDLTDRSQDSARLATLQPAEPMPALVLAYDYYEDAGRDADLVARNGIRHPGFVPAAALKVLTR